MPPFSLPQKNVERKKKKKFTSSHVRTSYDECIFLFIQRRWAWAAVENINVWTWQVKEKGRGYLVAAHVGTNFFFRFVFPRKWCPIWCHIRAIRPIHNYTRITVHGTNAVWTKLTGEAAPGGSSPAPESKSLSSPIELFSRLGKKKSHLWGFLLRNIKKGKT